MKITKSMLVCPDCGCRLELSYERADGTKIYYCPYGDEEYYFIQEGEYLYVVCFWDGKKTCIGVA